MLFFSQAEEVDMLSVDDCAVAPTVVDVPVGKLMVLDDVCKVALNWDDVDDVVWKNPADVDCGIIEGGFVIDIDGGFIEAVQKT